MKDNTGRPTASMSSCDDTRTDSDRLDLARQLVAWSGWRQMPGMRLLEGGFAYRVLAVQDGEATLIGEDDHAVYRGEGLEEPDLTDPATIGCLVALLYEATIGEGRTFPPGLHMSWTARFGPHGTIHILAIDDLVGALLASSPTNTTGGSR